MYILEKIPCTIKLPETSDGMKALWNMDMIKKINDCTGTVTGNLYFIHCVLQLWHGNETHCLINCLNFVVLILHFLS